MSLLAITTGTPLVRPSLEERRSKEDDLDRKHPFRSYSTGVEKTSAGYTIMQSGHPHGGTTHRVSVLDKGVGQALVASHPNHNMMSLQSLQIYNPMQQQQQQQVLPRSLQRDASVSLSRQHAVNGLGDKNRLLRVATEQGALKAQRGTTVQIMKHHDSGQFSQILETRSESTHLLAGYKLVHPCRIVYIISQE